MNSQNMSGVSHKKKDFEEAIDDKNSQNMSDVSHKKKDFEEAIDDKDSQNKTVSDVSRKKKDFEEAVDDKVAFQQYLQILKQYFRGRINKTEMTQEVFNALSLKLVNYLPYHKALILAISKKVPVPMPIDDPGEFVGTEDTATQSMRLEFACAPVSLRLPSYLCEPRQLYTLQHEFMKLRDSSFTVKDSFSNISMLYGQICVVSWENDLMDVSPLCTDYIAVCIRWLLKNILVTILSQRPMHRYPGMKFRGASPVGLHSPTIKKPHFCKDQSSVPLSLEVKPLPSTSSPVKYTFLNAIKSITTNSVNYAINSRINIYDLYCTLQACPSLIPEAVCYNRALENCFAKLIEEE